MRSSICFLLAAIAVMTSCSTYMQSGMAERFQDGIYYKASDAAVATDSAAVSTSLIPEKSSGGNVNVYVNPIGFSFGFALGYPWINNWYWDNWYWDRWGRPWWPWRHWHPWHPWDPWDPWHPWWPGPGPGPIYVRDPYAIWSVRDPRAGGGTFTYNGAGSAGSRFSGGASSSGRYGRSLVVGGGSASGSTGENVSAGNRNTSGQSASQSSSTRSYGRDVQGAGSSYPSSSTRSNSVRSISTSGGSSSRGYSPGPAGGGVSRSSGGFSGGMSTRGSGSAGFRR